MGLTISAAIDAIIQHDPFIVNHEEWTTMVHPCPVCLRKDLFSANHFIWNQNGHWHHPGGNKAEFRTSKSSEGYICEYKGNKIRCDGCKSEHNAKDWSYKCPNHDYEKINDEWRTMYHKCPVCIEEKSYNDSPKGYWYHPGGNKAEFRTSKPSTYAVEMKLYQIRCSGCKNECDVRDWVFKCPNHDYKKIKSSESK